MEKVVQSPQRYSKLIRQGSEKPDVTLYLALLSAGATTR